MTRTRQDALRHRQQDGDGTPTETGDEDTTGEFGRAEQPAEGTRQPQAPAFQLPEQFLSTLVDSITRAQAEANRTLISSLMTSAGDFRASTPVASTSSACAPGGNFTKCTARFDGSSHDGEVLEAFLDAVEIFKDCAAVSDEHALRGLPMLLEGDAAIWWRGVKSSVATWHDALARLRAIYGVAQPAYKIFRQIFASEQQDNERAEVMLCKVRALFAKLPYKVDEVMQVDMCYGLLCNRLKKRVPRESVSSLDELLCNTRIAEDNMKEYQVSPDIIKTRKSQTIPTSTGQHPARSNSPCTSTVATRNKNRPRCSYCRAFGHISDECRNREKTSQIGNKGNDPSYSSPKVVR
ncbi:activity-regulated cytoskeleton associated protein 1-like [Aricia agestis]|uniref:activity-regulated cytoskeleton associated protein 1-like n=1 Tax=Aricia agestis TaxID=91739 RepID=UPI001C202980|nr:activity-regulated cytoskeleton associated protein 1-like [Aricia agestis]